MANQPTTLDRLAAVPIFSELSKTDLRSISRLMTSTTVKEGKNLTKQGQIGREFVIILEGKADVMIDFRRVATLSSGDFFGELSLLSGDPRNATVVARTDMLAQVLTRQEFLALLDEKPVVAKKLLVGVVKRYQSLQDSIHSASRSPVS